MANHWEPLLGLRKCKTTFKARALVVIFCRPRLARQFQIAPTQTTRRRAGATWAAALGPGRRILMRHTRHAIQPKFGPKLDALDPPAPMQNPLEDTWRRGAVLALWRASIPADWPIGGPEQRHATNTHKRANGARRHRRLQL